MALIDDLQKETERTIKEMTADGLDMTESYAVEHHFASYDFKMLEKMAVDLFGLGYDVTDADVLRDERNKEVYCFDAICDMVITPESMLEAQQKFLPLLAKYHVMYDGWGVSFDDGEEESEDIDNVE
ncbi:MAG: ribonuclease E inhibitor RraB [Succinivibrionaceae bacterium]